MDFVVVDIENTSLQPPNNEIIEIGAVRLQKKDSQYRLTDRYSQLVKPFHEIPPVVQHLTGITARTVKDAPRFREIAGEFRDFVGDAVFVAHNAQFDLSLIDDSLARLAQPPLDRPCLDTQDMVAIAFPAQSSHRLGDLVKSLGIEAEEHLHRALADAEATARLLLKSFEAIAALPPAVFQQMRRLLKDYQGVEKNVLEMLAQDRPAPRAAGSWKNAIGEKQRFEKSLYLQEKETAAALDLNLAAEYFAADGRFKNFPHYEHRPQQQEMAAEIIAACNNGEHLLLEAGTGSGKSAAYLVSALLWLKQNGGPLVVSTRTKTLQDQLVEKDIPAVLKLFPDDQFQIMVLKGRQNYVCLRRFEELARQMILGKNKDIAKILPLFSWLVSTAQGDLSELHTSIERKYHYHICSEGLTCLGDACPDRARCFLQHARRQARFADLIVVNHALVFSDLLSGGQFLPKHRQIIFDEAHTLEDAATDSWSLEVGYSFCADEVKKLEQQVRRPEFLGLAGKFRENLRLYFEELARVAREYAGSGEERALRISALQERSALWSALEMLRLETAKRLRKMQKAVDEYLEELPEDADGQPLRGAKSSLQELWKKIETVAAGADNYVSWLALQGGKSPYNVLLKAAPVDVGALLQEHLFTQRDSVIMVSATLTINGSFDYFAGRFGFVLDTDRLRRKQLGSPFDYQEKMLCLLPDDLGGAEKKDAQLELTMDGLPVRDVRAAEPRAAAISEKEHQLRAAEYLAQLAEITEGRMLALFTSYRSMEQVFRYFRTLADDLGIQAYCQKTHGSRRALLNRLRGNKRTVLFGTSSFWEGVDIQGDALSVVAIFRLPFAVPTEPVTEARSAAIAERSGKPFFEFSLPQAVIRFKQGVGRLIRSKKDRGIITIIDERVWTKNYGRAFLRSIPECEIVKAAQAEILAKAREWF